MFGNIDIMHKVIQWYMRKHEECTRDHASVFENIPIMYQGVCYFFLGGAYMLSIRKYVIWEGGTICYPTGSILHVVCGKTLIKCAKYTLNSILIEETTLFFSVVT